nr:UBN2_2 domain-containing protein [Tanacetum cinerariifolium]
MAHDSIVHDVRQGAKVSRNANYKRKWKGGYQNNMGQQNKRQNVVRAYTVKPNNKNGYAGSCLSDQVKLSLEVLDLNHALRIDPPSALTAESTVDQVRAIPDSENAKEYLSSVEEQFKGTSKAHASTLILKMLTTKYDGVSGVCEHIMMMSDMANKLKGMDMEISKGFLVHFIMTSLPMKFGPFKINYNMQKEKWKMSELIAMCVQEEECLKVKKPDVF